MPSMSPRGLRLRATALLAGAALALHQLRYLLAYGDHSQVALALQGHYYLALIGPVVIGLVVVAAGEFLVRLAHARRDQPERVVFPRTSPLWALASGSLLAIYTIQESLEGQLEAGHPGGLAGSFGHGGWIAVLLAVALGALIALLLRGADAAIKLAARGSKSWAAFGPAPVSIRPLPWRRPRLDVLASFLAGRGPPLTSV
jgi:hypothetical protein